MPPYREKMTQFGGGSLPPVEIRDLLISRLYRAMAEGEEINPEHYDLLYRHAPLLPPTVVSQEIGGKIMFGPNFLPIVQAFGELRKLQATNPSTEFLLDLPEISQQVYSAPITVNRWGEDLINGLQRETGDGLRLVHYFQSEEEDYYRISLDKHGEPEISQEEIEEFNLSTVPETLQLIYGQNVVDINLEQATITFRATEQDFEQTLARIIATLGNTIEIPLDQIEETSVDGYIRLYGISYDSTTLTDFILNFTREYLGGSSELRRAWPPGYFYLDEGKMSSSRKKLGPIYLTQGGDGEYIEPLEIFLSQGIVAPGHPYQTNLGLMQATEQQNFVLIEMRGAYLREILLYTGFFFYSFLRTYCRHRGYLTSIYNRIAGGISGQTPIQYMGIPKIKVLAEDEGGVNFSDASIAIAPNLFVANYTRHGCPRYRLPYISDEEVPGVENQAFRILDSVTRKPIKTLYFNCTRRPLARRNSSGELQYSSRPGGKPARFTKIGLKDNTHLPNSDLYPEIPCCYDPESNMTERSKKAPRNDTILTTQYELPPGRTAIAIFPITLLLGGALKIYQVYRTGLDQTRESAILHLLEVFNPGADYDDGDLREIHRRIAQEIHPEVAKSEFFDRTPEQIREQLLDLDNPLDVASWFSHLREFFQVNIVIFNNNPETNYIQVPRGKFFTPYDITENLPTIAFHFNGPGDLTALSFDDRNFLDGGSGQNKILWRMLQRLYSAGELSDSEIFTAIDRGHETMVVTETLASGRTFRRMVRSPNSPIGSDYFQGEAVAQWIDAYGKVRMIADSGQRSIFIQPRRPFNLPSVDRLGRHRLSDLGAIAIPSYIHRNQENQLDGIWIPRGRMRKFAYYPLIPQEIPPAWREIPEVHYDPSIDLAQVRLINNFHHIEKLARMILELCSWMFAQYIREFRSDAETLDRQGAELIKEFLLNWILTLPEDDPRHSMIDGGYRLDMFSVNLPDQGSLAANVAIAQTEIPSFFRSNRLIVVGRKMWRGLISYLRMLWRHHDYNLQPIARIGGILTNEEDFNLDRGQVTLITRNNLIRWLNSGEIPIDIKTVTKLDYSTIANLSAAIYRNKLEYYIIQNVVDMEFERAYSVAWIWHRRGYNSGATTPPIGNFGERLPYPTVEFVINKRHELSPIEEIPNQPYLMLLRYRPLQYAAILPLRR